MTASVFAELGLDGEVLRGAGVGCWGERLLVAASTAPMTRPVIAGSFANYAFFDGATSTTPGPPRSFVAQLGGWAEP